MVRTAVRHIGHVGGRHMVEDYAMEEAHRNRVEDYEAGERRTGLEGDHVGPEGHRMVAVEGDTGYVMVRRMEVAAVAGRHAAAEAGSRRVAAEVDSVLAGGILAGRMVEAEERRSPAVAVDSPEADIGLVEAGRSPVAVLRTGDSHPEEDTT